MNTMSNYTLRMMVFTILLFSLTHIGVMNVDKSTILVAAAGEPSTPIKYINNPFSTPDWISESDLVGAAYGASVTSAGDVNGDGYADIIVGAPDYKNSQDREGRAYVYHGSAIGIQPLPAWTFESNLTECGIGWSVTSAGDVNGDGFDDVLVGSEYCSPTPATDNREGRVYLFLGSATGLSTTSAWMIQGGGAEESLGWSIASAGDVNNDGYDDVIVGAPWASYPEDHEGRAYVFYGSASGLAEEADWITESNVDWSDYGVSVASAGDVNNDGYDDVIIGHGNMYNPEVREGRVYVYLGSATGLSTNPLWQYENNHTDTVLGESVACAGDVNGDGFSDVIVGGFRYGNPDVREGISYLFLGSASGPSLTPNWQVESNQAYAEYGQSVASAGDVNQDGFDDVLVGAPWYSQGEIHEGRELLYYGSPTGLLPSPIYTTESNQEDANLGYSVASAGDVNGDGIADIIVGAQRYDGGQADEGRAIVYYGIADLEHIIFVPIIRR